MRNWIPILLLLSAALGGCAGDADDTTAPTQDPAEATGEDPGADPGPTGSADPADMLAILDVDTLSGTAPVSVNFTLAGNNTSTHLTWTLVSTFDGTDVTLAQGDVLPAEESHVFETAGNHTVTFTIDAGGNSSEATSVIKVLAAPDLGRTDLVATTAATGTFAEDAVDTTQSHDITVGPGAKAITIMGDWTGGIPEVATNWAYPNDLDIYLKAPGGSQAAAAETLSFEYLHHEGDLTPGTWALDILAFDLVSAADYSFDILVWYETPTLLQEEGSTEGDVDIDGESPYAHQFELPADVQTVAVQLTWTTAAEEAPCNSTNTRTNDLDLSVKATGEAISSGYFHSCEFGFADAEGAPLDRGTTWTAEVVAFTSPAADYQVSLWYA